ncbi:MAG: autotransporter-associated beta strand repeat-containing protein, partial [Acidovorax sp.]|nr:autotransporter-associated beta strand repeat-containing protein [Acidovorax sp.]
MARPKSPTRFHKRSLVLLALPCSVLPWGSAWAQQCNGGATVTGALTISANCAGGGIRPLNMGTGANVMVNAGVTVSNDAGSGRNGDPISVLSSATASTLTNNGTIHTPRQVGLYVNGRLTSLVNTGTISSGMRRGIVLFSTNGILGTLTNTGSILGPFAGITNRDGGVLQTFNNLQGAGNTNGAVTYTGLVPTNYNIIINSPGTYGKLSGSNEGITGSMAFGIYSTSTAAIGTYTGVLNNFTAANLSGTNSGSFGGLNWVLSLASGSSTIWDLIFSAGSVNMAAGSSYTLADVGTSINPVFDGGTLLLPANANSAQAFTLNAGGATVTSPAGSSARLSGVLSGLGGLTVNGSGMLALSGNNTYAGGTTVSSGSLSVSGTSPLGTGSVFVAAGGTLMGTGT